MSIDEVNLNIDKDAEITPNPLSLEDQLTNVILGQVDHRDYVITPELIMYAQSLVSVILNNPKYTSDLEKAIALKNLSKGKITIDEAYIVFELAAGKLKSRVNNTIADDENLMSIDEMRAQIDKAIESHRRKIDAAGDLEF